MVAPAHFFRGLQHEPLLLLCTRAEKMGILWLLACFVLLQPAVSIPLESFYPFGGTAGDTELPSNDDGSTDAIILSIPFPFFANLNTMLYVRVQKKNMLLASMGIVDQ